MKALKLSTLLLVLVAMASRAAGADTPTSPTAAEIVHRAIPIVKAAALPWANALVSTVTERGRTYVEMDISSGPKKLLIRRSYPWLSLTTYEGYDGTTAWSSSSFGGGGPLDRDASERFARSAQWFNSTALYLEDDVVELKRLPDVVFRGTAYYAVSARRSKGQGYIVVFDKRSGAPVASGTPGGRYTWCVRRKSQREPCFGQIVVVNGRIVGSVENRFAHVPIDDIQFEMPVMLDDPTTPWLLQHYAAAVAHGAPRSIAVRSRDVRIARYGEKPLLYPLEWSLHHAASHGLYGSAVCVLDEQGGVQIEFRRRTWGARAERFQR